MSMHQQGWTSYTWCKSARKGARSKVTKTLWGGNDGLHRTVTQLLVSVAKLRHLRVALSVSDRYGLQVDAILLYYELHSHRWQEFVARFYAKQGEFFTMANEPSLKGLYRNSCRGSKLTFAHCFHISKFYIDEFSSYLHWQMKVSAFVIEDTFISHWGWEDMTPWQLHIRKRNNMEIHRL